MADDHELDWLRVIAEQAKKDLARAEDLRTAIETIGKNSSGACVTFTTDFIGDPRGYVADNEVGATLKEIWPNVWETTMRRCADELAAIETRYQHLRDVGHGAQD